MGARSYSDLLGEITVAQCNSHKLPEIKNLQHKLFPFIQDEWLTVSRSRRVSFLNAATPRVLKMLRSENPKLVTYVPRLYFI